MALDLNKEISFKKKAVPSAANMLTGDDIKDKAHLNLMTTRISTISRKRLVLYIVLAVVVITLLCKFCVYDFYANVATEQAQLDQQQETLAFTQSKLGDYDAILQEYQSYTGSLGSQSSVPDALVTVNMIMNTVGNSAAISNISIADSGEVNVGLANITLKEAGSLAKKLRKRALVEDVSVSTAGRSTSSKSDKGVATLVITLKGATTTSSSSSTSSSGS